MAIQCDTACMVAIVAVTLLLMCKAKHGRMVGGSGLGAVSSYGAPVRRGGGRAGYGFVSKA